eukprot:7072578-Lingulodinium_polyedra.AAC.1
MDFGFRTRGLPSHELRASRRSSGYTLVGREDNQAMMRCIETGRNPTMRYLRRAHCVSVVWLRERFSDELALLQ